MKWWKHVIAMEIRKILAYRSDFWVIFLGQILIQVVIARALWGSIFESRGATVMEGFTLPMMTLYFLIVPIGNKMLMGENIGFLSREIYDGSFTRYLIYPISFFQYKTLTYLTFSAFYGLQLILIFCLYQLSQGGVTLSMIGSLFLGVSVLMVASFAYAMLSMLIELISLWADNIWSLMIMVRFCVFFLGGAFIPIAFFPHWAQKILEMTPFPYLVSFPARTIMGIISGPEVMRGTLSLLGWGLVFLIAARLLWKRGEKKYTGVGI